MLTQIEFGGLEGLVKEYDLSRIDLESIQYRLERIYLRSEYLSEVVYYDEERDVYFLQWSDSVYVVYKVLVDQDCRKHDVDMEIFLIGLLDSQSLEKTLVKVYRVFRNFSGDVDL